MNLRNLACFTGLALLIANTGDFLSTLICLSLGAREINPLYYSIGPIGSFMVKIFLPIGAVLIGYTLTHFKVLCLPVILFFSIVTVMSCYAIINNIGVILQLCHV